MPFQFKNRINAVYDRLTVIALDSRTKWHAKWLCRCTCGKEVVVSGANLGRTNGSGVKSCGCWRRERQRAVMTKHGLTYTPRFVLWNAAKRRAKKAGTPFTLTLNDMPEIPATCPMLGIPLEPCAVKPGPGSPSLDRIVPSEGYVPGNVQILSLRANVIKNDGTAEEHEKIAAYMRKLERTTNC